MSDPSPNPTQSTSTATAKDAAPTTVVAESNADKSESPTAATAVPSTEEQVNKWEGSWKKGIAPGQAFDGNGPLPYLKVLLEKDGLIPKGKGLIPGFGRGYCIEALAGPERHVTGVEIAPSAVKAATEYLSGRESLDPKAFDIVTGSFFELLQEKSAVFDFAYDYTFLCALPPSLRADWGDTYQRLVKPGGVLMTVVFPIDFQIPRPAGAGPPFDMTVQLVSDLLTPRGFVPVLTKKLEKGEAHPGRYGGEGAMASTTLVVWKKKEEQAR